MKVWLPSDEVAQKICSRSVLLSNIIELIGENQSVETLKDVQDNSKLVKYAGKSFRCKVDAVNETIPRRE